MRDFVLPVTAGVAVAFGWLALWGIFLRACGIPALKRSPEERAARKERIVAMGKLRYVIIFGILGKGMGFGLAMVVANNIGMQHFSGWRAATQLAVWMIFYGLWYGVATWNQSFRGEVPFPPHYPPQQ
jgi:hypothetical protein